MADEGPGAETTDQAIAEDAEPDPTAETDVEGYAIHQPEREVRAGTPAPERLADEPGS